MSMLVTPKLVAPTTKKVVTGNLLAYKEEPADDETILFRAWRWGPRGRKRGRKKEQGSRKATRESVLRTQHNWDHKLVSQQQQKF